MKIKNNRCWIMFLVCALLIGSSPGWVWTGKTASAAGDFAAGSGTLGDPYQIATADQLNNVRDYLSSHFILIQDIDLSVFDASNPWEPIGTDASPFTGSLDGQGHKIANLFVEALLPNQPAGLFGVVRGTDSFIRNVTVEAISVTGLDYAGILAGYSSTLIQNVGVTGSVYGQQYVGGLTGYNANFSPSEQGIIENSHAEGYVEGDQYVGGLAGENGSQGTISGSHAAVIVKGINDTGGLVGVNSNGSTIANSYAEGNVSGSLRTGGLAGANRDSDVTHSYAIGSVEGVYDAGGLIGLIHNGTVSFSFATGKVSGSEDVGGLVGIQEDALLTYSYASGDVAACGDAGGLVGDNDESLISNSFATGNVICLPEGSGDSIGGLVGDNSHGDIEFSFSTGRVSIGFPAGGFVGYNGRSVTDSYYNADTSGLPDNYATGLTTDEMKDRTSFPGWDDTIWGFDEPHHGGFPYLRDVQAFITYAGNGTDSGSEHLISLSYLPGTAVKIEDKRNDWTKTGFSYKGWNTEADGSGTAYAAGDTIVLNDNVLLHADWEPLAAPHLITPANGQYTNVNTPTVSGTATAEATAAIVLNGDVAATAAVDMDGNWSWVPGSALADGTYTIAAGIADWEGQPVNSSDEHTFTVDTEAPVITFIGDAAMTIAAGTPFTDPGVTVTDADEGVTVTTTGDVDHEVPGVYTLQYDAVDRAGNAAVPATRTVEVVDRSPVYGSPLSANANLSSLIVKAEGGELALTPEFEASTVRYEAETTAGEATIEAIAADRYARVSLADAQLTEGKTVDLEVGSNEFEIVVTAENGFSVKTYYLTIYRLTEDLPEEPDMPTCTFVDISGHWAERLICEAFEIGIVNGHSKTSFDPQAHITRVEFAAMLLRTLGMDSGSSGEEIRFNDQDQVPSWATETVSVAVGNGVLEGYPDGTLRPLQHVNRAEMVAMIAKAMKWETEHGKTRFADDAEIPDWVRGYVHAAEKRNVVNGREDNRFSPMDPATRAEAAVLLLRLWYMENQ